MSLPRPAAGGESCKQDSFLGGEVYYDKYRLWDRGWVCMPVE